MRSLVLLIMLVQQAEFAGFPQRTGHVNDFSNVLTTQARAELEQLLSETQKMTTAEVVVATVPSLHGTTVEEYGYSLFRDWGIGKNADDKGVLVLVAPNEREMWIEVGYGLNSVLPGALAQEITRTKFLPRFKKNDYPRGLQTGIAHVIEVVRRDHVLTAEERDALQAAVEREALQAAANEQPLWLIPFFALFAGVGFFLVGVGIGSKAGHTVLVGSLFGAVGLLLLLVLIPMYVIGPFALATAGYGVRKGRRNPRWM
jgi:uncharacterized protein